jgi:hypothetical protein
VQITKLETGGGSGRPPAFGAVDDGYVDDGESGNYADMPGEQDTEY